MENMLRLPVNYNLMTEEEMTYTNGGSSAYAAPYVMGAIVGLSIRIYNYAWGISKSQEWIRKNKTDDLGQTVTKALNDFTEDMSKGLWNTIRDIYTAYNLGTLWPVTLVMFAIA